MPKNVSKSRGMTFEAQDQIAIVILRDKAGNYFVHRRSFNPSKIYFGLFGLGAGGKKEKGESIKQAALRELQQETGIDLVDKKQQNQLRPLGDFIYKEQGLAKRHIHVFLLKYDPEKHGAIQADVREWIPEESGWMTEEEVEALAAAARKKADIPHAENSEDKRLMPDTVEALELLAAYEIQKAAKRASQQYRSFQEAVSHGRPARRGR